MTDRIPPVDPLLAAVLAAAVAPAEAPLPGEEAALHAFREAHPAPAPSRPRRTFALLSASLLGTVVLAGGVAAAAGGLPFGGSQRPIDAPAVPGHNPGSRSPAPLPTPDRGSQPQPSADPAGGDEGRGDAVTGVARTHSSPGRDRGDTVCDTASEGACASATPPPSEPPSARPTRSELSRPDAPATAAAVDRAPAD
jgi:hypothetical protein